MNRCLALCFFITAACSTASTAVPTTTTATTATTATTSTTTTTTSTLPVAATVPPTVAHRGAGPVRSAGVGAGAGQDTLACIRHVESRGRYNAVSASGKYHGAYQADHSAWGGYGGYGEADQAPPEVQDRWAAEALATRGIRAWGAKARRVCG